VVQIFVLTILRLAQLVIDQASAVPIPMVGVCLTFAVALMSIVELKTATALSFRSREGLHYFRL
jgi:hypothetical protein